MSFYRPTQMAAALCFGVTLALVECWEILRPIWREEWTSSAEQWLGVASATLVGCAMLVGAAGALFGLYAMSHTQKNTPSDRFSGLHEFDDLSRPTQAH
jgi:hypothetical protein